MMENCCKVFHESIVDRDLRYDDEIAMLGLGLMRL